MREPASVKKKDKVIRKIRGKRCIFDGSSSVEKHLISVQSNGMTSLMKSASCFFEKCSTL